jgi:hypothetical protein
MPHKFRSRTFSAAAKTVLYCPFCRTPITPEAWGEALSQLKVYKLGELSYIEHSHPQCAVGELDNFPAIEL